MAAQKEVEAVVEEQILTLDGHESDNYPLSPPPSYTQATAGFPPFVPSLASIEKHKTRALMLHSEQATPDPVTVMRVAADATSDLASTSAVKVHEQPTGVSDPPDSLPASEIAEDIEPTLQTKHVEVAAIQIETTPTTETRSLAAPVTKSAPQEKKASGGKGAIIALVLLIISLGLAAASVVFVPEVKTFVNAQLGVDVDSILGLTALPPVDVVTTPVSEDLPQAVSAETEPEIETVQDSSPVEPEATNPEESLVDEPEPEADEAVPVAESAITVDEDAAI